MGVACRQGSKRHIHNEQAPLRITSTIANHKHRCESSIRTVHERLSLSLSWCRRIVPVRRQDSWMPSNTDQESQTLWESESCSRNGKPLFLLFSPATWFVLFHFYGRSAARKIGYLSIKIAVLPGKMRSRTPSIMTSKKQ